MTMYIDTYVTKGIAEMVAELTFQSVVSNVLMTRP